MLGSGDVKYHLGATGSFTAPDGQEVRIHLASNPSHLEAVDPVIVGRVRAKQCRLGEGGTRRVVPVMVHGDSAFAGQGMLAEVLNLADLPGYKVGGTVHVVANNLIGFTTEPREYSSTRYSTDVARRLPVPIFHVNAEDPDAVVRVARIATEFRHQFGTDVVVDLVGYRRHGHSEVDDPTITQPRLYAAIERMPPLWKSYAEKSGAGRLRPGSRASCSRCRPTSTRRTRAPARWRRSRGWRRCPTTGTTTAAASGSRRWRSTPASRRASWRALGDAIASAPEGFHVHAKVPSCSSSAARWGAAAAPSTTAWPRPSPSARCSPRACRCG